MVEKFIGKEIAWRKKHGFSHPIWKQNNIKKNLKIKENILSADLMHSLPWAKNGKIILRTIFILSYLGPCILYLK